MPRTVEFPPDGSRILASPREIVNAWRAATTRIPAKFALGTAQHESNFTINEVDTEESDVVTIGIYQLSAEEAAQSDNPNADLTTLADSTSVFATLCERRVDQIITWAALAASLLPSDVWAYLYIAHNQGAAACRRAEREIASHHPALAVQNRHRFAGQLVPRGIAVFWPNLMRRFVEGFTRFF